jgi:biopolymer transport protein ExbD
MVTSTLQTEMMKGPLYSQSSLKPRGKKSLRNLLFVLNLTALIDAFSMLVIFLLSNMGSDQSTVNMSERIKLPFTQTSDAVAVGAVIRIEGNTYALDDKPVTLNGLIQALVQLKQKTSPNAEKATESLVIQADQGASYDQLSPVLKAGGQAGFSQFKFAVLQNGRR